MYELELGLYDLSMVNTTYFVKLSIWRILMSSHSFNLLLLMSLSYFETKKFEWSA